MNKKLALTLVLIIATAFRLANITSVPPGLYPDEAMNGSNASEAIATGEYKIFYPENNGREGLFINIQSLSVRVFGNTPWALRIPSALFGIATVLGIYFLSRELFGKESIALLSAFLSATGLWHIIFSRIGFRAIMAPFFLVWAVFFLLLALRKYGSGSRAGFWIASAAGGTMFGLGMHSYIAYRAMPLVFLAFLPFFFRRVEFYKSAAVFAVFALIAFAPLLMHFVEVPQDFFGRTTQISVFDSESPVMELAINTAKTAGMLFVSGDRNWRHNLSGYPALSPIVAIFFAFGIVAAIGGILKKKKDSLAYSILIAWIASAALPVIVSNEGLPHALRAILMIPPVFILSAVGAVRVFELTKDKLPENALKTAVAAVLLILTAETAYLYFYKWAASPHTAGAFSQNYADIAKEINLLPEERDKIIIVDAGGVLVRGVPMPAQTVMFLTNSFTDDSRAAKHIRYVSREEFEEMEISPSTAVFVIN